MKTTNILIFGILFCFQAVMAQEVQITGSWKGALSVPGDKLNVVINIAEEDGKLISTLDSPDQMVLGIPVTTTSFDGEELVLDLPPLAAAYKGRLLANGSIQGTWTQSGMDFELVLSRTDKAAELPRRPQEPMPPFPYDTQEVVIHNTDADVHLAGTLTIPKGNGPFPAVILISGSGPQNRDEEIAGHKPFLVLADFLTRNGIATLRYDDRGVAQSTGDFASATSLDFMQDAHHALEFLRKQKRIDKRQCGLAGHSEGGMVAQMLAAENKNVAFVVLMAAPGVPSHELLLKQSQLISKAQGASASEIERSTASNEAVFDILRTEKDIETAREAVINEMMKLAEKLSGSDPDRMEMLAKQLLASAEAVFTPWFLFFINYNPADYLSQVSCPVLAINGEKDTQVDAVSNINAIVDILNNSGNKNVTGRILPELNHLFQTAKTGAPNEYGKIEETFSPVAMRIIADWIVGL